LAQCEAITNQTFCAFAAHKMAAMRRFFLLICADWLAAEQRKCSPEIGASDTSNVSSHFFLYKKRWSGVYVVLDALFWREK
jgi:hypothetical protein